MGVSTPSPVLCFDQTGKWVDRERCGKVPHHHHIINTYHLITNTTPAPLPLSQREKGSEFWGGWDGGGRVPLTLNAMKGRGEGHHLTTTSPRPWRTNKGRSSPPTPFWCTPSPPSSSR